MSQSDSRNPQDDPRVGDVLQVIPPFGRELPKPMTVLSVDENQVSWTRGVTTQFTDIKIWRKRNNTGGGERLIVFADRSAGDQV